MSKRTAITSSEIGILWMTYKQKTMITRILDYFIEQADDEEAKEIMTSLQSEIKPYIQRIADIFKEEGMAVPLGFTEADVNKEVPKLYDNGFDIMLLRLLKQISMGMHTLNLTMAYREDIINLFRELTVITQRYYEICTAYLLQRGLLTRSPSVPMPVKVDFVKDNSYLGGINPLATKRSLNTVEVSHMYHAIEANLFGMTLIKGFAQCAHEQAVKDYFTEGGKIAQEIIKDLTQLLTASDLKIPVPPGGNITKSILAPFSDKLMMYCVSLFCSFSLGGNSLGTAFSLRNDIAATLAGIMKDVFEYAHKGAKLMIKHSWMEEPPPTN
ncbi:DUF3231 family protein [Cytobacillus gottheilii]|uniref:DUF3231 family protein n=1 Tax=Cytobacillus gottheilii TaxID=859144 RepID=UPI00082F063B|nr:DUF3231 family protein [Cytobacillus gottheilii]